MLIFLVRGADMTTDMPTLADDIAKSPRKKCTNCGHNVMIYHHPLGSNTLMFHDNDGVFAAACACGCKNPKTS